MRLLSAVRASRRTPALQVAKSALATIGAWLLASWLIPLGPPPVFAAIAALLVVQPSLNQSYLKAIERSAGVVAGVVVASLVALAIPDPVWALPAAVAAALLLAWATRMTAGTSNQAAISALLVIALGAATPGYAVDRVIETILGAIIGFVVNLALVPPVAVAPAREGVARLAEELARSLERLADALVEPCDRPRREGLMVEARLLRPMREAAEEALRTAEESLTLNPRARRHRDALESLRRLLDTFTSIVTQTIGMSRAFYDHYDDALAAEPAVAGIAEQLHRAAHDVRLLARRSGSADATPTETLPALTSPLSLAPPSGPHWILVGSLLEDLRRVHGELAEAADDPPAA